MPIDLSEVALDPDLVSSFCILRHTGVFGPGGWLPNPICQIPAVGIIEIATAKDLKQVPQGDRVEGSLLIILAQPINVTSEQQSATSDTIFWCGDQYRVQNVQPWKLNGYWSAILVRMTGS